MRVLTFVIIAALFAVPARLSSQADEVLSAVRVEKSIMLGLGAGKFSFAVDQDDPSSADFQNADEPVLFSVRGRRSVAVMLSFLNPLKYSWTMSSQERADSLIVAAGKFVDLVSTVATQLGGEANKAQAALDALRGTGDKPVVSPAATTRVESSSGGADLALLALSAWKDVNYVCFQPSALLDSLIVSAERLDELLQGSKVTQDAQTEIRSAADFRAVFANTLTSLSQARSLQELEERIGKAEEGSQKLQKAAKLGQEGLLSLSVLVGRLATPGGESTCDQLARHSKRVLQNYISRVEPVVQARVALAAQFKTVLTGLKERVAPRRSGDTAFKLGDVVLRNGRRSDVTVTVTERKFNPNDGTVSIEKVGESTYKFQVMPHQSLVWDFVQGVAYSNVSYPKFRTNITDSGAVVADAGVDRPKAAAVAMFNLIPNTGWSGFSNLVFQIGFGATEESPLILGGVGLRLTLPTGTTFLTFGASLPFVNSLKSLAIGDSVAGEAALKQDIELRMAKRPAFYIGVQR